MIAYHVSIGSERNDALYAPKAVLVTYSIHDVPRRVLKRKSEGMRAALDCGAFPAWKAGKTLDLAAYIATCRAVRHSVDFFAAMDVIGDAKASLANWERMRVEGLTDAAPTFHVGSDVSELVRILDARPTYMGLGGLVGRGTPERIEWLDWAWARIVRHPAWPLRVHGWGQTERTIMLRYPWASVDSTSLISSRKFGSFWTLPDGRTVKRFSHGVLQGRRTMEEIDHVADLATEKWKDTWQP